MYIRLIEPIRDGILAKIPFGSHCYGTANKNSDRDYLCILKQDTGDLILRYDLYRTEDLTYVGVDSFWKTVHNGAEQVYFEAMHTPEFGPYLPFYGSLIHFYNDRVARMYVGYARRDLKQDPTGRLFHINRCLYMAKKVMKKELIDLKEIGKIELETDIEKLKAEMTKLRNELIYG